MGARPMARVIQEHIKKPLADEVLFGKLKDGGHVRVIVLKDETAGDKLGFEYLDGPIMPKPEKIPPVRVRGKRRSGGGGGAPRRSKPPGPKGDGPSPNRGSVPKIPLVKV
jgi:ATP-dependent Clp protease ATP-binding subunit ClpA